MDSRNSVDTLQWLGFYLRGVLKDHLPQGRSLTVQGAVNAGGLLFLMQHGETIQVHESQVFQLAQTAFQRLPLTQFEYRDQHIYEVRLYLRVQGQRQPYASHRFGLELPARSQPVQSPYHQGDFQASEGVTALHANGYETHGHGTNGSDTNGSGTNGHGTNGSGTRGNGTNGHGSQSHGIGAHGSKNGSASRVPVAASSPIDRGDREPSEPTAPDRASSNARENGWSVNGYASAGYASTGYESAGYESAGYESTILVIRDLWNPDQRQPGSRFSSNFNLGNGTQGWEAGQSTTATIAPPTLHPDAGTDRADDSMIEGESAKWPTRKTVLVGTGTVAGVCAAIGASYVLSRPCVIGECPVLSDVQNLDQALQNTQDPWSIQQTEQVKTEMGSAIQSLEKIPIWSRHYEVAQTLLADYRAQEVALENLLNAYRLANQAAQQSLNPPHPAETWTEIVGLWQAAIAQLEGISPDSAIYPIALEKLQEYRQNLTIATRYQALENNANDRLDRAQKAAGIAEARQGIAQNVDNWQLVRSTWQVAVNELSAIPESAAAYRRAAGLLPVYEARLAAARDRLTREKLAANTYSQAIAAAGQARNYEQQSQWQSAVEKWQQAATYVQQVGQGTFYYDQAQALTPTYQASLQEARGRLTSASQLVQTNQELAGICEGSPQVCQFTVGTNLISVRLTQRYFQQVQAAQRNSSVQPQLSQHLQGLQAALVTVSNNANLPLELYGPDSQLLGRYMPLPFGSESATTLMQPGPSIGNDR